jgi:hypothetical protein
VLPRGIFLDHEERAALVKLRANPQVTVADVPLARGEQEDVAAHGVVLHVGDHLGELLDVGRLQVDDVEGEQVVLDAPQVDAQVVGRQEVLPVGGHAQRVDVVVVAVLVLLLVDALEALLDYLLLRQRQTAILNLTPSSLLVYFVFHSP